MIPEFFTVGQLIKLFGGDPGLAKNPRFTSRLSEALLAAGYTQRMIHSGGILERTWSRNWKGVANKTQPKGKVKLLEGQAMLLERIIGAL